MKKITYEIKLEKSVKIILGTLVIGIMLNAFATPIAQELFGFKEVIAETGGKGGRADPVYIYCLQGC